MCIKVITTLSLIDALFAKNDILYTALQFSDMFFTYNLYWCNAPHQLLKERGLTIRKLPDTVPNELLLVLWEAIAVSPPQQAGDPGSRTTTKRHNIS